MREKFEEDVVFTIERIVGKVGEKSEDSLERAIACLSLGVEDGIGGIGEVPRRRYDRTVGRLRSWAWVAASVCLREVERFRMGL